VRWYFNQEQTVVVGWRSWISLAHRYRQLLALVVMPSVRSVVLKVTTERASRIGRFRRPLKFKNSSALSPFRTMLCSVITPKIPFSSFQVLADCRTIQKAMSVTLRKVPFFPQDIVVTWPAAHVPRPREIGHQSWNFLSADAGAPQASSMAASVTSYSR
jgi:hypothetical protein